MLLGFLPTNLVVILRNAFNYRENSVTCFLVAGSFLVIPTGDFPLLKNRACLQLNHIFWLYFRGFSHTKGKQGSVMQILHSRLPLPTRDLFSTACKLKVSKDL